MTEKTVRPNIVRSKARKAVNAAITVLSDGGPIGNAAMLRAGMTLLGHIREAFIAKARGGADETGDRWQPLSPRTIAYSKTRQRGKGGRTRTEKKRDTYPSQALNKKQQERWWEVYRRQLAIYKGDKRHAAAVAWVVLKSEGATTLVDKYGHRQVEILRDTGLLLNSLSPGVASAERIFRIEKGAVTVGTNRKGAMGHHHGIPGRLPQRRLWPPVDRWPAEWWRDILEQIKQAMIDATISLLKG